MKTTVILTLVGAFCALSVRAQKTPEPDLYAFERRREVFEFTQKPTATRAGDTVTVSFAVKDFCDVTVAVEDNRPSAGSGQTGRIVRHLASGVLGANAPEPFQRNALEQTVIWDGKDDQGVYVDDKDSHSVRVSLGLKPQFERTLFWSPKKRVRSPRYLDNNLIFAAGSDGVYIYDGGNGEHIRLFDRQGEYARTVYPPPAALIENYRGLTWKTFPQDGRRLPEKTHCRNSRATFLTTSVSAMAAHGGRLVAAGTSLVFFSEKGGSFQGPDVFLPYNVPARHDWRGGVVNVPPTDIAFSPDSQWIYLAGYMWSRSWRQALVNGVARIRADGSGKLENFVGSLSDIDTPGGARHGGTMEKDFLEELGGRPLEPGQFGGAVSVDVDAQGRVFVADHQNDRIRVFNQDGGHIADIAVSKPSLVRVHPRTGEIYVFSYRLPNSDVKKPTLTRLKSLDEPVSVSQVPLPAASHGRNTPPIQLAVDFQTDPPTIWTGERANTGYSYGGSDRPLATAAKMWVEKDGKLVQTRDFADDIRREVVYARGTRHMKQRLYFDPRRRRLYVGELFCPHGEHVTTMLDTAVICPDTGRIRVQPLPMDAEDMAFCLDGFAYLRSFDYIARFDPGDGWREIPFDYGEELETGFTFFPRKAPVISAISFYSTRGQASSQMGGLGVSPKGHIVVSASNPTRPQDRTADKVLHRAGVERYTPRMFPGRFRLWEVHVFDRHGKRLHADAVPGIGRQVGLNMDADDNIYALVAGIGRVAGKPYEHPFSCSLIKVRPGTRVLSTRAEIALPDNLRPNREPDLTRVDGGGSAWLDEGAFWIRGGVGFDGKRVHCHCPSQSRPAFDTFARSFLPEPDRYSVLAVDKNNNEIVRIGTYGNVDDGEPLIRDGGPPNPRALGGDEVALKHPQMLVAETDRRLFIGDLGNARIAAVKLNYHAEATVALKNVPDEKETR